MLSDQQLNHFRTFGFVRLRQLFDSREMERITELTNRTLAEEPARPDACPGNVHVAPFMEKVPELALLPEDERFYAAAEQLLGAGFVWGDRRATEAASTTPTVTVGTATAAVKFTSTTPDSKA